MRRLARVVGMAVGATVLVLSVAGTGGASSADPSPATPAVLAPVNVPAGPQQSASDCPNPPELSSPLPTGATLSGPSLVPPGLASITAAGKTYALDDTCEYTLTLPASTSAQLSADTSGAGSDGIVVVYVGSDGDFYFPTGVLDPITFTYSGRTCNTSAEIVSAFGLAVAEQETDSGYCTSNSYDPGPTWGFAEAINTSLQTAPAVQEPTFHTIYQSHESGSIFFGQFQECEENPIGQQSTYVCAYDNYGPLF